MMAYRVVQWEAVHETAESRKYKALSWFAKPNKHDGLGYAHMMSQPDPETLYAGWGAILDVASKGPRGIRGWLVRGSRALTAEDLAAMTKFGVKTFVRAFEFFVRPEVGWLAEEEFSPGVAGRSAGMPGVSPGVAGRSAGMPGDADDTPPPPPPTDRQTVQTDRQTGEREKTGADLRIQFVALQEQIRELTARKEDLTEGERVLLRKKKAQLREVRERQANGA